MPTAEQMYRAYWEASDFAEERRAELAKARRDFVQGVTVVTDESPTDADTRFWRDERERCSDLAEAVELELMLGSVASHGRASG